MNQLPTVAMSIKEMKELRDKITGLYDYQLHEVFRIIQEGTGRYTKNSNGIFVNMKTLSHPVLWKIHQYVSFSSKNNLKMEQEKLDRDQIRKEAAKLEDESVQSLPKSEETENRDPKTENQREPPSPMSSESFILDKDANMENITLEVEGEFRKLLKNSGQTKNLTIHKYRPKYQGVEARIIKRCKNNNVINPRIQKDLDK